MVIPSPQRVRDSWNAAGAPQAPRSGRVARCDRRSPYQRQCSQLEETRRHGLSLLPHLERRAYTGRTATLAPALRHQIVGGTKHRPRYFEEPRAHPNAARIALIDVDRRRPGVWRANLGMGTQIAGVAHQEEAGDLAEHIGYPLQPALHRGARKLASDLRRNLQPERGRVELLLRKTDRARANVFVGVEADLLEDGGQRPDLNFTVMD